MTVERGKILGSGDEEDVEFLEALKGLVDGAVKLLGADKGVGNWLMSGLLRKSGVVEVSLRLICVRLRCALRTPPLCTSIVTEQLLLQTYPPDGCFSSPQATTFWYFLHTTTVNAFERI